MLPKPLWKPSEYFIENSNLKRFENWLLTEKGLSFKNDQELWQWSIDNIEDFWLSIWQYFEVISHSDFKKVLDHHTMPNVKWFEGATLNYSEHIFRNETSSKAAILFQNEDTCRSISWNELTHKVKALQAYLKQKGIKKGDCVAAFLPNIPEAIICFLAVNSLGAVWSCCSPDFGVDTVVERFDQIKPKVFIAADGYQYNGKPYSKLNNIKEIYDQLESADSLILIPYLNENSSLDSADYWSSIVDVDMNNSELIFEAVPFDHPIWVLYSSGTTGKPKAITHSHGGVLLEHLKYMSFHNDVKSGENFFWFTTTGWMMWNFLQASMLVGATPVLYDGSPGLNNLEVLWEMAERLPVQHFGTSAPFLTACMQKNIKISSKYNMSALRSIGSTGAPLPPETFEWIYENISKDLWLCSMSGGTDVCTAFVGGHPYKNVYKGLIQSRALGCALKAYDSEGKSVEGSLAEMVIEKPMPSMPIYFWNDKNNERYKKSYFEEYPGKWRHGDWIKLYEDGSLIIQGRSDSTLNRKGIRIGTAEIYNIVDKIPGIQDSLILNLELEKGGDSMPLFIVLKEGIQLDDSLELLIKKELKEKGSPRHVPDSIYVVPDIPYTLSGKKMEVPIKKILMGMDISKSMNRDAIKNPEAIDWFLLNQKSF